MDMYSDRLYTACDMLTSLFAVGGDHTVGIPDAAPQDVEEGFTLEPLDITGVEKKVKAVKKRRLVVDTDKEFSGEVIKSQFTNYKDTLQPKCFPPPTKKAMMWKEMASCEQLFSRPTFIVHKKLSRAVTRNYKPELPEGAKVDPILELDELDNIKDVTENIEQPRDQTASIAIGDVTAGDVLLQDNTREPIIDEFQFEMVEERPPDMQGEGEILEPTEGEDPTSRVIPEMPSLEDGITENTEDQQEGNELSEEFEARRWTKRTQQVIRVLDRGFKNEDSVEFSSLTQRCNRKLAASRFYTCLLLAKEKMITLEQGEAYSEITVTKGAKFTDVF